MAQIFPETLVGVRPVSVLSDPSAGVEVVGAMVSESPGRSGRFRPSDAGLQHIGPLRGPFRNGGPYRTGRMVDGPP